MPKETTSITVSRNVMDYIESIRGMLSYYYSKKVTLDEALRLMCMWTDLCYAHNLSLVDMNDQESVKKFMEKRIKQFIYDKDEADRLLMNLRKEF